MSTEPAQRDDASSRKSDEKSAGKTSRWSRRRSRRSSGDEATAGRRFGRKASRGSTASSGAPTTTSADSSTETQAAKTQPAKTEPTKPAATTAGSEKTKPGKTKPGKTKRRKTKSSSPRRSGRQLRAFLRAIHPRQALAFAVVVATLVAMMGRPAREVLVSAAAVFVTQALLGVLDDRLDAEVDRRSGASHKPVADGIIPRENATFAVLALLLLAIPLSLQNGIAAGLFLLATLVVGFVHNRWLHRTLLSWVGWCATFALLAYFVTLGGWGNTAEGSLPFTSFVLLCAALGFCVHFLTALPDLVVDNRGGVRHLPLRIALRTGAPKLLAATILLTVVVLGALVWTTALNASIAR